MGNNSKAWIVFLFMFFCIMLVGAMLAYSLKENRVLASQNLRFAHAVTVLSTNNDTLRALLSKRNQTPDFSAGQKEFEL